jgi:hypothetical protein
MLETRMICRLLTGKCFFDSRAPVLSLFKKILLQVIKNLNIILEIVSDTSHTHGKPQAEVLFTLCYIKMTISDMS